MRTSSSFDAYETPQWLVKEVTRFFGGYIDLDPCTSERNPTGALHTFTNVCLEDNGLEQTWNYPHVRSVYVNSPYGRQLPLWAAKAYVTRLQDPTVDTLQLLPARFGSTWFRTMAERCDGLGVFDKRLSFTKDGKPVTDAKGKPCTAQFDTCLVYYGLNTEGFKEHFAKYLTYWSIG